MWVTDDSPPCPKQTRWNTLCRCQSLERCFAYNEPCFPGQRLGERYLVFKRKCISWYVNSIYYAVQKGREVLNTMLYRIFLLKFSSSLLSIMSFLSVFWVNRYGQCLLGLRCHNRLVMSMNQTGCFFPSTEASAEHKDARPGSQGNGCGVEELNFVCVGLHQV